MQFPYLDLGDYQGPRDLSPQHIQAILNRPYQQADAHVEAWLDEMAYLEFLQEEEDALERKAEAERQADLNAEHALGLYNHGIAPAPWNERGY